jgi:hypothetical protein
MSGNREELIRDLVADLKPVERPGRVGRVLGAWLAAAVTYSVIIVVATGPIREGALGNLLAFPSFALETLLAAAAIGLLARATLTTSIPGRPSPWRKLLWPLVFLGAWISVYLIGFVYPAHPVSTLGNRDYCVWQVALFSVPSFSLLLWMVRRQLPLWPRITGMTAGAAAAAIPAALMQFGCMYVPSHILTHHIGPIFVVGAVGFLIGPLVLKTRRDVPRRRDVSIH